MSPPPLKPALFAPGQPPVLARVPVIRSKTACVLGELAPMVEEGRPLYCADGGNYFDPYVFGQYTRQRGTDPEPLLERVFVSRAFTIHQLEAVVADLMPPLLEQHPVPVAAVLAIDFLFLEESLSLGERKRVFTNVLDRLEALGAAGLPVLVTHDPPLETRTWADLLRARRAFREFSWGDHPDPAFRTYPSSRRSRGCHGAHPADV